MSTLDNTIDNLLKDTSPREMAHLIRDLSDEVVALQEELENATDTIGHLSSKKYEDFDVVQNIQHEVVTEVVTDLCCGEQKETVTEKFVRSSELSEEAAKALVAMVKKVADRTLMMANKGIASIE